MKLRLFPVSSFILFTCIALCASIFCTVSSAYADSLSNPLTTISPKASQGASASSTKAVYWIVHKKTGENLYTTAQNEVNTLCNVKKTWTNKGTMWYAPTSGEPVYRLYNPKTGDHHFTKSANEVNVLTKVKKTWQADFNGKPIFYSGGSKPVWRLRNDSRIKALKAGTHQFAISQASVNSLKKTGWISEGIALYCNSYKASTMPAKAQFSFFADAPSSNIKSDPNKFYGAQGVAFDTYTGKDGYAIAISKLPSKKNGLVVKHYKHTGASATAGAISVVKSVEYSEAQLGHANDATIYKKGSETYLLIAKGGLGNTTACMVKLSEYNKGKAKVYPVTLNKLDTGSGADLRGIAYVGNKKVTVGGKSVAKDVFIVIAGRRANLMYVKSIGASGMVLEKVDSQRFQAPKFGSRECTASGIAYHNGNVFFSWGDEKGNNRGGKVTYISYTNLFKGSNPNTAVPLTEIWSKTANTDLTPEALYFTKLEGKAPLYMVYNTSISGGRDYIDVTKQTY